MTGLLPVRPTRVCPNERESATSRRLHRLASLAPTSRASSAQPARNRRSVGSYGEVVADDLDAVDDSPWRPDADVEFDHGERRPFAPQGTGSGGRAAKNDPTPAAPVGVAGATSSRRRRWAGAATVVVLAVLATGAIVLGGDDSGTPRERSDAATATSPALDLPDARAPAARSVPPIATTRMQQPCTGPRLPTSIDQRWTTAVGGAVGFVGPLEPGPGVVAALTQDRGSAVSDETVGLVVLRAEDGTQLWRTTIEVGSSDPRIIEVADGTVLVETIDDESGDDLLTAYGGDDGRVRWTRRLDSESTAFVHPQSATLIIERVGVGPNDIGDTRVFDVETGAREHVGFGRFVTIDADGRLVTLAGGKVLSASDEPADTGRLVIGLLEAPDAPFAVLGTSVVTSVGDPDAVELFSTDEAGRRSSRSVPVADPDGIGTPGVITSITAIGPSGMVLTGRGATFGADLVDDVVVVRWKVDGAFQASVPSDLGRTLMLAGDGGATQFLVDAATGEEFFALRTATGALGVDDVFANGLLRRQGTGASTSWRASDLDDEELWRFGGLRSPAVGFELVYDSSVRTGTALDPPTVAASIAAFGPVPDPSRECVSTATDGS